MCSTAASSENGSPESGLFESLAVNELRTKADSTRSFSSLDSDDDPGAYGRISSTGRPRSFLLLMRLLLARGGPSAMMCVTTIGPRDCQRERVADSKCRLLG